jgi:hypothetical protein
VIDPRPLTLLTLALAGLRGQEVAGGTALEFANAAGTLRVRLREQTLGFEDPSMNEESAVLSPDGRSLAYMITTGNGLAVVHNGEQGESFEAIPFKSIVFSPDGSRLAYAAYREGKQHIVLDGKLFPYQAVTEHGILFSPDGRHAAWVVQEEEKQMVVLDGERQAAYDGIDKQGVVFSHDSQHVAYVATQGEQQFALRDGREGPLLDSVVGLRFTPDGKHLVYVARASGKLLLFIDDAPICEADAMGRGLVFPNHGGRYAAAIRSGDEWKVLIDGSFVGPYKNVFGLSFSPDGAHLAYVAGRGEGMFLVLDGEERRDFDAYGSLSFAPVGDRMAFTARRGALHVAVIDGKVGPAFDALAEGGVHFSADGRHTWYSGTRDDQTIVVLDGKESTPFTRFGSITPRFGGHGRLVYSMRARGFEILVVDLIDGGEFDELHEPAFSRDGSRFAYAGRRGSRWFVVDNGIEVASYPYVLESPVVSDDGKRMAYRARTNMSFVVVDGTPGPKYDQVRAGSVAFSPAGTHIAYAAATAERRYLVVDDVVIENGYKGFLAKSPVHFSDEDHASFRASKNGRLVLIELEIVRP